ncbi:uncharacterized protein A4U43_C03F21940 [Asparagus officinalis]|uniref:non-specific serine/threonine protein kinase n=1 Tax=Asparagus officinalis TaxID=4686 RepID=A0A5P1FC15_ASPOF|nr:uncharacterized protein A4U43_C03F21940 [Asparagus officinalis]
MDMPIMHDSERYELVKDIGAGNFGIARLMRDKQSKELVAVKYIERGEKIDENVQREIINHRSLRHPNIIRFREVILTPTHLAIVMEYASGGELFERICNNGRFSENEARYFFRQLISGVSFCHSMQVCHRDLKLENTLLDGSTAPCLKICDFGYSKSSVLHSQPTSTVGTPAYIAPEVLLEKEYDGKIADVSSCGVTLYVMLVGAYPFEDPEEPRNFRKTIQALLDNNSLCFYIEVKHTVARHHGVWSLQGLYRYRVINTRFKVINLFDTVHAMTGVSTDSESVRISLPEIRNHAWFLKNLPANLMDENMMSNQYEEPDQPMQSIDEIMQIITEATIPPCGARVIGQYLDDLDTDDEEMEDIDSDLDTDSSGEIVSAIM